MSSCLLEPVPLPDPTKCRMTAGAELVELGDRIYFSVGSYLWEPSSGLQLIAGQLNITTQSHCSHLLRGNGALQLGKVVALCPLTSSPFSNILFSKNLSYKSDFILFFVTF